MPATQFFSMRKQAFLIDAYEKFELCRIAAIPLCSPKYYDDTAGSYLKIAQELEWDYEREPVQKSLEPRTNEDVKDHLMALFAGAKGGRYGL